MKKNLLLLSLHVENLINLFLSKRTANYKALRIIIGAEKTENENGQRGDNLISFMEEASKSRRRGFILRS